MSQLNLLVIGSGGREHALAWKLAASDRVARVYVAPGNAGTALEEKLENVDISPMDFDALVAFCRDNQVDFTVVGPEDPLVAGIVDRFTEEGLRCFGPTAAAAQLEGSKSFTKAFLERHGIPTAGFAVFDDIQKATAHVKTLTPPIVIKADGLAAGKGVVLADSTEEAIETLQQMLTGEVLAGAGSSIVIEDFLVGEEASFIVIADGENYLSFATSQDHKAAYDGDEGPNTGGMGAYSPAPVVSDEIHQNILEKVIEPALDGMRSEGNAYTGFLYAGLMIDPAGEPSVIEFNCRFGDPETQPVMSRLESDLATLIEAALDGRLSEMDIQFDAGSALTVVMASGGYPGAYEKGRKISGLDQVSGAKVFHAGTSLSGNDVLTSGGRVLGVTALGNSVTEAHRLAYEAVSEISFDAAEYRTDIGYRAIARENSES
ncbi:MAG: phosphoribosylamine--glycine ligase [Pseudomonadales bacterium]|jgi:phosphoribosylamine--glycine ligase|nr:phosphoribosylamine--glycine ligase [Pseudomonadales bacterium]